MQARGADIARHLATRLFISRGDQRGGAVDRAAVQRHIGLRRVGVDGQRAAINRGVIGCRPQCPARCNGQATTGDSGIPGVAVRATDGHIAAIDDQAIRTADNTADRGVAIDQGQIAAVQLHSPCAADASNGFIPGQGQGACVADRRTIRQAAPIGAQRARTVDRNVVGGYRPRQQNRSTDRHIASARKRPGNRATRQRLQGRCADRAVQQAARLVIGGCRQGRRTRNRAADQINITLRRRLVDGQRTAIDRGAARGRAKRTARRNGQIALRNDCAAGVGLRAGEGHISRRTIHDHAASARYHIGDRGSTRRKRQISISTVEPNPTSAINRANRLCKGVDLECPFVVDRRRVFKASGC